MACAKVLMAVTAGSYNCYIYFLCVETHRAILNILISGAFEFDFVTFSFWILPVS
jgi:hypothetical protein